MALETKTDLNKKTVEKLQDLIRINLDSENGFSEAANDIDDNMIARMFTELGRQRASNAKELQNYVSWNGETPVVEGSFIASLHRAWLGMRNVISGGDAHAILSEAERGEDAIKHAYEEALVTTAGSPINDVLTRQYASIKAGHDRVRSLRDQLAVK